VVINVFDARRVTRGARAVAPLHGMADAREL
jgi:hypothetical protein